MGMRAERASTARTVQALARWCCLSIGLWLLAGSTAQAHDAAAWKSKEDNAIWRTECGSCHMAFPPAMLAASDWLVIMAQLDNHFGNNAALDRMRQEEITNYLDRNAVGRSTHGEAAGLPRVTTTERFIDKHQGAIRLWRKGRVKTLSDCQACHAGVAPGS
jgi:cytochrome c5